MTDVIPAVESLLDFTGRTVLVTGAAGGIGTGIADRFAEAGATVVRHRRTLDDHAEWVAAELTEPESIAAMMTDIGRRFGALDVVVNNAGTQPVVPLDQLTAEDFDLMMTSTARSALLVSQAAVQASGGRPLSIVNVTSIEGLSPAEGHAHYSAAKAALIMLTKSCALEWARKQVRVNAVAPGLIDRHGLSEDWPEGVARWQAAAPLQRLGAAADVADACLFLASSAARWITGVTIPVDGGVGIRPAF